MGGEVFRKRPHILYELQNDTIYEIKKKYHKKQKILSQLASLC